MTPAEAAAMVYLVGLKKAYGKHYDGDSFLDALAYDGFLAGARWAALESSRISNREELLKLGSVADSIKNLTRKDVNE